MRPRSVIGMIVAVVGALIPALGINRVAAAPAGASAAATPATAPDLHYSAPGIAINLSLVPSGAYDEKHGDRPATLAFGDVRPALFRKAPTAPLRFASLTFAGKTYIAALHDVTGQLPALYVDANGNGDLTDDSPIVLARTTAASKIPKAAFEGKVQLPLPADARGAPVSLTLYLFDMGHALPGAPRMVIYFADYRYEGTVTLAGATYKARLLDETASGDFRIKSDIKGGGVAFAIDANQDGAFAERGELFPAGKPFTIKGITYELADLAPGGAFKIQKSDKSVPEISDLSPGTKILPFKVTTIDGKTVNFPDDFKGKIELLNFWATWCAPCMLGELPQVLKTYRALHGQGFEVLGISLDERNGSAKVRAALTTNGMTWPQGYDDQCTQYKVRDLYVVENIPACWFVDGDTGAVLTFQSALLGDRMLPTVQSALAKKKATGK